MRRFQSACLLGSLLLTPLQPARANLVICAYLQNELYVAADSCVVTNAAGQTTHAPRVFKLGDSACASLTGFSGPTFKNKKTGQELFIEDISEDFPVTFLMGEISVEEFRDIAVRLTPKIDLLEVDSSWEGKPTTIVVAMMEEQVRDMFGRRTKMRKLAVQAAASRA